MLSALAIGIGVVLILIATFGHQHAERGARELGHSGPALGRGAALAMGALFIVFGLLVYFIGG